MSVQTVTFRPYKSYRSGIGRFIHTVSFHPEGPEPLPACVNGGTSKCAVCRSARIARASGGLCMSPLGAYRLYAGLSYGSATCQQPERLSRHG